MWTQFFYFSNKTKQCAHFRHRFPLTKRQTNRQTKKQRKRRKLSTMAVNRVEELPHSRRSSLDISLSTTPKGFHSESIASSPRSHPNKEATQKAISVLPHHDASRVTCFVVLLSKSERTKVHKERWLWKFQRSGRLKQLKEKNREKTRGFFLRGNGF